MDDGHHPHSWLSLFFCVAILCRPPCWCSPRAPGPGPMGPCCRSRRAASISLFQGRSPSSPLWCQTRNPCTTASLGPFRAGTWRSRVRGIVLPWVYLPVQIFFFPLFLLFVCVLVLPPIETKGKTREDVSELTEQVRTLMGNELKAKL